MPRLVTNDGTNLLDDLTPDEIRELDAHGVEIPDVILEDARKDGIADQHDIPSDVTIETTDVRDRMRWIDLIKQLDEYESDLEQRKRTRDTEAEAVAAQRVMHADVRAKARESGVIEDLKRGFEELVTRPAPKPAEAGPRLNTTNVVRRAAGDVTTTELFEEERIVETGNRCIGLCMDVSGSMGKNMMPAKLAGACIAKSTEIIDDTFVWETYQGTGSSGGLDLNLVTAHDESFEWEHLDSIQHKKGTPTAAGIRDTRMLMEEADAREYAMIVVTDGKATHDENGRNHSDNSPVEQARCAVTECRNDGIDVIGVGLGTGISHTKLGETFGEDGYVKTDVDDLADDLLTIYRRMLDVER